MRRELTEHAVNPANEALLVFAVGSPGAGGAPQRYMVKTRDEVSMAVLHFQNGAIQEVGVNGITHEVLLAIVADRLRAFQAGQFANRYNAEALAAIEAAQSALKARTLERMQRGVEGTHQV